MLSCKIKWDLDGSKYLGSLKMYGQSRGNLGYGNEHGLLSTLPSLSLLEPQRSCLLCYCWVRNMSIAVTFHNHLIRSCGLKFFSGLSQRVSLACDHLSPAHSLECSATLLLSFVWACSDTLQSWDAANWGRLPWDWPHPKNLLWVMLPCQLVLRMVHGWC